MNCRPMASMAYDEFIESHFERRGVQRLPLHGTFELTHRCNYDCCHCYIVEPSARDEMSADEACRVLDEVAGAGCLFLLLTGGEVLLRRDFASIYLHAHRLGFLTEIHTNAALITTEMARLLADHPPTLVEVSVYGGTDETSDRITRRRGSLTQTLLGVDKLVEAGLRVALKTVVMTPNVSEHDGIRSLATSRGLPYRYDPIIQPRLDGSLSPCAFRLNSAEVVRLEALDPPRVAAWRRFVESQHGRVPGDRVINCGAGIHSFCIDSRARLSPCAMLRGETYDLRSGSFRDGWERWMPGRLEGLLPPTHPCRTCEIFAYCDSCAGWTALEPEVDPVPFACEVAHLRARAFSNPPPSVGRSLT